MSSPDLRTLAVGKLENAAAMIDTVNATDAGGDKLICGVGAALVLAITGLAYAVLAGGGPEKGAA